MSLLLLKRAWKSNFFRSHKENCTKGLILSNAYSYFEKVRRKKCTRQSRIVLWVVFSSLFFKEIWKNGKMGHGYMSAGAEVSSTAAVWGTVYWSYRILPFGIVACTFFRQPCSKYGKIPKQNVTWRLISSKKNLQVITHGCFAGDQWNEKWGN